MSKTKKKHSTTMEDHGSLRYRDGEVKVAFFDKIEYDVSSILLELSHPVVFSTDSPYIPKWGRTKKRTFLYPPEISPEPVIKSLPSTEVGEIVSTSSSSCLTGEAKKPNRLIIKKLKTKISSKPPLKAETSLISLRAQVDYTEEKMRDYQNLRHLQPLIYVNRTANMRDAETSSLLQQASELGTTSL